MIAGSSGAQLVFTEGVVLKVGDERLRSSAKKQADGQWCRRGKVRPANLLAHGDDGAGGYYLLMERVRGVPLWEAGLSAFANVLSVVRGNANGRVEIGAEAALAKIDAVASGVLATERPLVEAVRGRVVELFAGRTSLDAPGGLSHGDLTLGNMLTDPTVDGGVVVFDFLGGLWCGETPLTDIAKLRQDTLFGWTLPETLDIVGDMDAMVSRTFGDWIALDSFAVIELLSLVRLLPYASCSHRRDVATRALSSRLA